MYAESPLSASFKWAHAIQMTGNPGNEEPALWENYIIKNAAAEPDSSYWQISQQWTPGHLPCGALY